MPSTVSKALLIISNLLTPLSLLTFATGFFPYKPFLPGQASFDDAAVDQVVPPIFDKVIFMVVDALRRWAHVYLCPGHECTTKSVTATLSIRITQALRLPRGMKALYCACVLTGNSSRAIV